jgi:hypothetical protein
VKLRWIRAEVVVTSIGVAMTACGNSEPTVQRMNNANEAARPQEREASSMKRIRLRTNIPTAVGQARIAAGNIWDEEYTPDGGVPTRGMTAHLTIMQPSGNSGRRVRPGLELVLGDARIRVIAIDDQGVEIEVSDAPPVTKPPQ